jgi:hypothetical protein
MKISTRSVLMAGVTTLTASAVAIAPTVQPLPEAKPAIQLAASVQQLAPQPGLLPILLTDPLRLLGPARPIGTITPPPAPIQFAIAPNLADTIDHIYVAVEPWVRWGFQVATDIVAWVPYVGWFAGQIMVFYNFGQSLVASGVFNFTDWLRGNGGVVDNLVDFGVDTFWSFVYLGIDEWNYFLPPLPPLPFPIPDRPPAQGAGPNLASLFGLMDTPEVGVTNAASDLVNAIYYSVINTIGYGVDVLQDVLAPIPLVHIAGDQVELLWDNLVLPISNSVVLGAIDPILNAPLNINTYINAAYNVGATTLNSLIDTGFAELDYFLGGPFLATANAEKGTEFNTSEVGSVPSLVKDSLNGVRDRIGTEADVDGTQAGPLAEVTKTVRDVRKEVRASLSERRADKLADAGGNGVVRAQGQVRGPVADAVNDVVNVVRGGKSDSDSEGAKAPSTTVAKSVRDTVKKVVKDVRDAAKDARQSVKAGSGDDE